MLKIMAIHQHHRSRLYKTRRHLAITIAALVVPFCLFLFFSKAISTIAHVFFVGTSVSLVRMAVAYMIAAFLGWAGAVLFYKGKRSEIALPLFDVLQSFPVFAALPLAVQFLGASNTVVIFFLVIAIIWPIFFSVISSLKLVKRDWEEAATIANLKGWDYLKYFLIPVSIPGFMTGSIIGIGDGWEALIGTEIIVGVQNGAGVYFQQYSDSPELIVFGILGFLVIVFGINKVIWLPLLAWSHHRMEE